MSQEVMEVGQLAGAQGLDLGEASTSKSSPPKEGIAAGAVLKKGVFGQSRYSLRGLYGGYRETLGCVLIFTPALFFARERYFFKVLSSLKSVWV